MTVFAQNHTVVSAAPFIGTPLGYQQISAATLAAATTLTVPASATYALVQCEGTPGTDDVRWRDDGIAPTAAIGMLMPAAGKTTGTTPLATPWFLFASDLSTLQFILGAGSPILNVSYYR